MIALPTNEALRAEYLAGARLHALATKYGVSIYPVWRRVNGLESRPLKRTGSPEKAPAVLAAFDAGATLQSIANAQGMSIHHVCRIAAAHGRAMRRAATTLAPV